MASSSSSDIFATRRWMYNRIDPETQTVSKDFAEGLTQFMSLATAQTIFKDAGKMVCPCIKCKNEKFVNDRTVWNHLYLRRFTPNYFMWLSHGEIYAPRASLDNPNEDVFGRSTGFVCGGGDFRPQDVDGNPYVEMVRDAFGGTPYMEHVEENPNEEVQKFYDMLEAARRPLYDGCREGLSQLSLASRMVNLKTDHNLSEACVDSMSHMMKDYLPEDSCSAESYYDIKKMRSLGLLSYQKIDVCQDNCMIFWKDDAGLENCKFCGKDRFFVTRNGKIVPHRRMWYLPITDRLKRMYQSERTARYMKCTRGLRQGSTRLPLSPIYL